MADFVMSGIDELAADLKRLGQLGNDELIEKMLDAGADVVIDEWKKGIKSVVKTKRSSGDMEKSVNASKLEKVNDISSKTIYPTGKDSKGVRNAEKAFILHYGKSGQPPTLFVDDVESKAEEKAVEAMENIFNEFLEKEGL